MTSNVGRRMILLLSLCAVVAPAAVGSGPGDLREETLENGFRVLVREMPASNAVSVRLFVGAGSILEGEYLGAGISHYVEHVLHGGTTSARTEEAYRKALSRIGGASNAYTSTDHTCYYITTDPAHAARAMEFLSEWTGRCLFVREEVDREKGVIEKEINLSMEEPGSVLRKNLYANLFLRHPAGIPVIGFLEDFRALTRDDLLRYWRRMYVPNNMILVVAGRVRAEEVIERARDLFGPLARRSRSVQALPEEPPQLGRREVREEMDVKLAYLRMGYHTVSVFHEDLYPLDVLSYILTNGESSRLYRSVKDREGLVYSISSASVTPAYDAGVFQIGALLDPSNLEKAEGAIQKELVRLAARPVSEEELRKAKRQKVADHIFGLQTPESQASDLGWNAFLLGEPLFSERYVSGIQEVTAEEVRTAARRYLRRQNLTVSVVAPLAEAASVSPRPSSSTAEGVSRSSLPNGAVLLLQRDTTQPVVSILAGFHGGLLFEEEGENGIGNFMTEMLPKGTVSRTALQIARELEGRGGELTVTFGNNSFFLSLSLLKEDLSFGLELLADMLVNPAFPSGEMKKKREEVLAAIRGQDDGWEREALLFFKSTYFRSYPYRMSRLGRKEVVERLTREDLATWHREFCFGRNMVLAVFGDIEPEQTAAAAGAAFASLPRGGPPPRPAAKPEAPPEDRASFKPNEKKQAVVVLGYPAVRVTDPRRPVLDVIDAMTSGVGYPSGWFHETLRGQRDLVYYVHGIPWMGPQLGLFYIMAQTTPGKAGTVVKRLRAEMERLKRGDFAEEELGRAKGVCVTMQRLSLQTPAARGFDAALNELLGLGYDYSGGYEEKVRAVASEDVRSFASEFFNRSVLAVTGPGGVGLETMRKETE